MKIENTFYDFWLTCLIRIPPLKLHQYVDFFGGTKEFYDGNWKEFEGITSQEQEYLLKMKEKEELLRLWEDRKKQPYRFLSYRSEEYPKRLMELPDYPYGIFWSGKPLPAYQPIVAMVGARKATLYGQELAYQIAEELGRQNITVVSGLASGIDASSHRGCLDGGGFTAGILGSGIDIMYPKENYSLWEAMKQRGAVLTEYPPGTPPLSFYFPRRNRMISVLADLVLVVEAKEKSGSLITVDFALEQGRDICAVPGRPCDTLSTGCNHLIQQGAKCILSAEDVMEELMDSEVLRQSCMKDTKVNKDLGLAPKEKMVYSCLRLEPKFIDDILCQLDIPVWEGIQILTELEIKGVIKQNPHLFYYRI